MVTQYAFVEGVPSPQLWAPDDRPVATWYWNLKGSITVTTAAASLQTTGIYNALCNLFGRLNWTGNPIVNNGQTLGAGRNIKGIPAGYLYLKWLAERGQAPLNTSTTLGANIAQQTYNINITLAFDEFNPKFQEGAQRLGLYRGIRFGRAYWQWQHGYFCQSAFGDPDSSAYINTGATAYTTSLTMTMGVDYAMDVKMNSADACWDSAVEYLPALSFGANITQPNNTLLSLNGVQDKIYITNTALSAAGVETGIDNIAIGNGGLADDKFGASVYDQWDLASLVQKTQTFFSTLPRPTGLFIIDQLNGQNVGIVRGGTLLGTSGSFYFDPWPGVVPGGSTNQSIRLWHSAPNPSSSFVAQANLRGGFGKYGGS